MRRKPGSIILKNDVQKLLEKNKLTKRKYETQHQFKLRVAALLFCRAELKFIPPVAVYEKYALKPSIYHIVFNEVNQEYKKLTSEYQTQFLSLFLDVDTEEKAAAIYVGHPKEMRLLDMTEPRLALMLGLNATELQNAIDDARGAIPQCPFVENLITRHFSPDDNQGNYDEVTKLCSDLHKTHRIQRLCMERIAARLGLKKRLLVRTIKLEKLGLLQLHQKMVKDKFPSYLTEPDVLQLAKAYVRNEAALKKIVVWKRWQNFTIFSKRCCLVISP